jgi:hypothetical protein
MKPLELKVSLDTAMNSNKIMKTDKPGREV